MALVEILIEGDFAITTVSQRATLDDILNFIYANMSILSDKNILSDMSNMNFSKISTEDMTSFLARNKEHAEQRKNLKTSVMAPGGNNLGMLRLFATHAELQGYPFEIKVFRSSKEARELFSSS